MQWLRERKVRSMTWHPIKHSSALDSVVWSVALGQPLVQRHQKLIEAHENEILLSLPAKSVSAQVQVQIDTASGQVSVGSGNNADQPAGVIYTRFGAEGVKELQLDINGQTLAVTSWNYDRWANVKDGVLALFKVVSKALFSAADIAINHLELTYKDVFWWEGDWQPGALEGLLSQGDPKLTPDWMFAASSFWHHDLGEIVVVNGEQMVERLALHCVDGNVDGAQRRMVVMDTTTRWLGKVVGQPLPVGIHGAFETQGFSAERCFDTMHDAAKKMFTIAVAEDMRKQLDV